MYSLVRRALFLSDPEAAHELAVEQILRIQAIPLALRGLSKLLGEKGGFAPRQLWGMQFASPLGMAAGFDKNGEMVPFLRAIGFGFLEVGTVTLLPQPGNPRPRMFRYPDEAALINRLGFNNDGAHKVAERLAQLDPGPPLFVNIGKNRDVAAADATEAYRHCYEVMAPVSDGVVVNLSSPNTPGLRDLQNRSPLIELLHSLRSERARTRFLRPGNHPILVKIAPDLDAEQLHDIAQVCLELSDGIVATNTTIQRQGVSSNESGGLSGRPLFELSTSILRNVRTLVGPGYPLVGVGGVFSADDVQAKMAAGADLVECYTGFIYEGPSMPRTIARAMRDRVDAHRE
ncbi:MAG TPA: quinone-dependent dihydroorotate dehydrogenase [Thermoanaerobaculia bacterium]|nr:quinone-dependent dihydroorotate dehydrogenase [Thermoanaerobaculia bacterium]